MVSDDVDGLQSASGEGSHGHGEGSFGQGEGSFGFGEGSFGYNEGTVGYGESTENTEVVEEMVTATKAPKFERVQSVVEETDFGVAYETTTAQTEQLSSAEGEEQKTFVIRSVVFVSF